ncbi:hypothetical protein yc1106_05428 [Curvularia clavata]|uniref:Rhodopsin domain-containing protein n=1 Tax=Curvularia clavata TaxID=95742 RepID=A0A9Q8ZB03_CURCL|nr:hypothetical protein yc1106_05428 [Curvularia clavata]
MTDDQKFAKETRVPETIAIVTVFSIFSCICWSDRSLYRRRILRNVGSDDYAILVAQILNLGESAVNYAMLMVGGVGRHRVFVEDKLQTFTKIMMAAMAFYNAAQIATKISLLLQYKKIFPSEPMQLICSWGTALLLLWGVAQQILSPFICSYQTITITTPQTCLGDNPVVTAHAVMNMVTDFLVLIIPIRPVVQLQINMLRKVYLVVVLCMGLAVCIISAIRLDMLVGTRFDWSDVTWAIAVVSYLSTVETSLGIACACIPTLRPLMKRILPAMMGSSGKDATSRQYANMGKRFNDSALKTKSNNDNAIYVQKDIHYQSTTELRDMPPKEPYSVSHRSSDEISLEPAYPATSANG